MKIHGIDFSDLTDKGEQTPVETQEQPENIVPEATPEAGAQEPTPQVETPPAQPEVDPAPQDTPQTQEFSIEYMFGHLSEKLGKEIKSYDDLISKPVEIDPRVKDLNDWSQKTGRPIKDYFELQKNWDEVSDLDVARQFLKDRYPNFSEAQLDYKMKSYIPSEDDLDEEKMKKSIDLAEVAYEGRNKLKSYQQELSKPIDNFMTDEARTKVQGYDSMMAQIQSQKEAAVAYNESLSNSSKLLEKIAFNLSEDLSIDFNIKQDQRSGLPDFINSMPHWNNEDGTKNYDAIVRDGAILKFLPEIIKEVYQQGQNSGVLKEVKNKNNITLDQPTNKSSVQTSTSQPKLEGIDEAIRRAKR